MKILALSQYLQEVGGVETYLSGVLPALNREGHDVAFACANSGEEGKPPIRISSDVDLWKIDELGVDKAVQMANLWKPDVVFSNGLYDPSKEIQFHRVGPVAHFMHWYYGTCLSGFKTFRFPNTKPCDRPLSWKCFALFYPRRCGGLNPVTFLRNARHQMQRNKILTGAAAVVTHSKHMLEEAVRNGVSRERTHRIPHFINMPHGGSLPKAPTSLSDTITVAFIGRIDRFKGVDVLIESAAIIQKALQKKVRIRMIGDGPAKERCERQSIEAMKRNPLLQFEFVGWVDRSEIENHLHDAHVLAMPSVWPEPYGQSGMEAASLGIPTAAFRVGGIGEWLEDNVNGIFAELNQGQKPATSFARAIIRCVEDPGVHRRLSQRAYEKSKGMPLENHVCRLIEIFEKISLHELHSATEAKSIARNSFVHD